MEHRWLYLVTDPRFGRVGLLAAVRAAAENGVDWVQVRDHQASAAELYDLTREIVAQCRPRGVRVAVNDRIDVALAAGADGVQLGARSLPIAAARQIAPGLRIGASVHDLVAATRPSPATRSSASMVASRKSKGVRFQRAQRWQITQARLRWAS